MIKVLFVCTGNICRSPLAHGLFQKLAREKGLNVFVDSAGLDPWHSGEAPQRNSQKIAIEKGFDISEQMARGFLIDDFDRFDYVVCMDNQNLRGLRTLAQTHGYEGKIHLLMDFAGKSGVEVPDPYGKDMDYYRKVYSIIDDGCRGLIEKLS